MTKAEAEAHLTRDLRVYVAEMLEGTSRNATVAVMFLEMGDDCGASYALRRTIAHVKAARDAMKMLVARKRQEGRRP